MSDNPFQKQAETSLKPSELDQKLIDSNPFNINRTPSASLVDRSHDRQTVVTSTAGNKLNQCYRKSDKKKVHHGMSEEQFIIQEKLENQDLLSSLKFFIKHSYRDTKRRKCHFTLALCSVFIVVIFTLVINTIVARGPVIFLKMSEGNKGEIDAIIGPSQVPTSLSSQAYNNPGAYLNYTRVRQLYGDKYNLSPRKNFCGTQISSDHNNLNITDTEDTTEMDKWTVRFNQNGLPSRDQVYSSKLSFISTSCVTLWNTEREREIEIGRTYKFEPLQYGECQLNEKQQQILELNEGDIAYFQMYMPVLMNNIITLYNEKASDKNLPEVPFFNHNTKLILPCKVKRFTSGTYGKFPDANIANIQMMEYNHFLQLVANYLPDPQNTQAFRDFLTNEVSLDEFADLFVMTLPQPRVSYYESSDYDEIQRNVVVYANKVADALGYYPISMQLDILEDMKTYSQAVLFLGLIFDIIIMLFVIIAVLLIYSLLMISVETKTFEIGVIRMVGLSKNGIILQILIQSLMFVLPALFLGFICSFGFLKAIYTFLFTEDLGVQQKPVPDGFAILQALIIGVVIPVLSSIIPIRSTLSRNLGEALDYQRSKTQAVYIQILSKDKQNISGYIIFGVITVIYGLSIYYFLPLSMLSLNFSMILRLFFAILLGMLFGLTLLAFNLQRILEIIMVYILLFFEKRSMKQLILKNLTAHRMRNKMTSIIFSLALGFIIFLIVSSNLQIKQTQLIQLRWRGSYLVLSQRDYSLEPTIFDPILKRHMDKIKAFTYIPFEAARAGQIQTKVKISDRARINAWDTSLYGVQPSVFDALISDFLTVGSKDRSKLPLAEQLYTARGTQGLAVGSMVARQTGIDSVEEDFNKSMIMSMYMTDKTVYYQMRDVFNTNRAPAFNMVDRTDSFGGSGRTNQALLASLPMYAKYSGYPSARNIKYERLAIMMKDPNNKQMTEEFLKDLRATAPTYLTSTMTTYNVNDQKLNLNQITTILNLIFNIIIAITMFLCFFSLSSSMSANLYEQAKEIGIMRAIGFTKLRIIMLYIYEAFILVIASSMLGVMIGTIIGFSMTLQQMLFTDIPLFFYFPWQQFIIIVGLSMVCAFFSTFGPTRSLMNRQISAIFRMT